MVHEGRTAFGARDEWFGLVESADHAQEGSEWDEPTTGLAVAAA
jgi:hypothetical protein